MAGLAPVNMKAFVIDRQASYMNEKITLEPEELDSEIPHTTEPTVRPSIEPDMAESGISAFKPLPSPPTTPKRIIRRVRLSAILAYIFGCASFVLGVCFVLARPENFEYLFILKLDTSRVGRDIIHLNTTTSTASAPRALQSLEPIMNKLMANLTDGSDEVVNLIAQALVKEVSLKDIYYLYLNRICERSLPNGEDGNNDAVMVDRCIRYEDASAGLSALLLIMPSSIKIGQHNVSVPILNQLFKSAGSFSSIVLPLSRALFAFTVISLINTGILTLLAIPSIFFRDSRLFIYSNLIFAHTSTLFTFVSAALLTILVAGVLLAVGELGGALGVRVEGGGLALAFMWASWLAVVIVSGHWGAVWFVEVRRWSFIRRIRRQGEVGNWRGMGREVWKDCKGEKSV